MVRDAAKLEVRLRNLQKPAQVETRLVSEVNAQQKKMPDTSTSAPNIETDWNFMAKDLDLDMGLDMGDAVLNTSYHAEQFEYRPQPTPPAAPVEAPLSQELISLGLDEPLPPAYIMDELYVFSAYYALLKSPLLFFASYTKSWVAFHTIQYQGCKVHSSCPGEN